MLHIAKTIVSVATPPHHGLPELMPVRHYRATDADSVEKGQTAGDIILYRSAERHARATLKCLGSKAMISVLKWAKIIDACRLSEAADNPVGGPAQPRGRRGPRADTRSGRPLG
jgi:hypothetical protein